MGFRDDVAAVQAGVRPAARPAADRVIEYAQRYHQSLRDQMADELAARGDTTPERWRLHRWYAALELTDEEIRSDLDARSGP